MDYARAETDVLRKKRKFSVMAPVRGADKESHNVNFLKLSTISCFSWIAMI